MKIRSPSGPALLLALCALVIGIAFWWVRPEHKSTPERPKNHAVRNDRVFGDFGKWVENFSQTNGPRQAELTNTGLELARSRRVRMEALILNDPQAALANAVTLDVWKNLPPELQREVEEPFSALGNFRVLPVCGEGKPSRNVVRYTEIEGRQALGSSVFGRRIALTTKENSPIQGIRLGGIAALRQEVFHRLESRETAIAEALYLIANPLPDRDFSTGKALGTDPVITLSGGRIFKFSDQDSLETFEKSIAALDTKPGPRSGSAVLFMAMPASDTEGAFSLGDAVILNDTLENTWTETRKKVLMIRCDFSDYSDSVSHPVVAQATYDTLLNTKVSDDIRDFSYGKTWIEATVSSDITRLTNVRSYYTALDEFNTSRNNDLLADAKSIYLTNHPGFNFAAYDIIGVWFSDIGMKSGNVVYAGLAGGTDIWIQNSTDTAVHVHEFGHNYGIGHSSFWIPPVGSTDPVDPAGTYEEYGDPFDVMGKGTVPEGVYHAEAKNRLNWLSTGQWSDATAGGSGTYRIKRIDNPNTTGVRGLRITKSENEHYWLSYRRLFYNSWPRAGANIVWEQDLQGRSWLIDTTPGSLSGSSDRFDGSLAIGRTYSDTTAGIHITALARGGTSPDEYLDLKVNFASFPGNSAPVATLSGPSTIGARQSCIFTAQASDPNGDELAYSWDFGQGFTFDNRNSASFAWNSGGTYTVKLTVSDMKGLCTVVTKVVTVSGLAADPLTVWTARANSSTGNFNTLVASPSRVVAAGDDFTPGTNPSYKAPIATSTDGVTWTSSQLALNQYVQAGVWDGSQFLLAGQDVNGAAFVGCVFTSSTANPGSWIKRIFTGSPLNGIAFGGGIYVTVGNNGTIRRSTDGTSWSLVSSGTTNTLTKVAYGGGKFVAVGYTPNVGYPTVLTSPDGSNWTNTSSGVDNLQPVADLQFITWAKDRFLASGNYGKLQQTVDLGSHFTSTRLTIDQTPGMCYGNGVWFAAGIDRSNGDADIDLLSIDGSNWTTLATPSLDDRNAAVFFNNTFITVGKNHSIRQSGTISPVNIGYLTWRDSYNPDHGSLSAPDEDGDGDSLNNLLEYALGSSPVSVIGGNGVGALPQAALFSSASSLLNDRIALQFSLPEPAPADMVYVVEASSTLSNSWSPLATKTGTGAWIWNGGGTSRVILGTAAGGKIPVTVGDSQAASAAPARFLRLRSFVNQ
ncbi:MAG: PKD domain-containing protein [Luteolibacter sp.]